MRISIDTEVYNEKRYGKPWIAIVTFESASKTNFDFGEWAGQEGYSGMLELECENGEIVAKGQKDNRKPKNSALEFYILNNGELESISKVDAYRHTQRDKHKARKKARAKILDANEEIQRICGKYGVKLSADNGDLKLSCTYVDESYKTVEMSLTVKSCYVPF